MHGISLNTASAFSTARPSSRGQPLSSASGSTTTERLGGEGSDQECACVAQRPDSTPRYKYKGLWLPSVAHRVRTASASPRCCSGCDGGQPTALYRYSLHQVGSPGDRGRPKRTHTTHLVAAMCPALSFHHLTYPPPAIVRHSTQWASTRRTAPAGGDDARGGTPVVPRALPVGGGRQCGHGGRRAAVGDGATAHRDPARTCSNTTVDYPRRAGVPRPGPHVSTACTLHCVRLGSRSAASCHTW